MNASSRRRNAAKPSRAGTRHRESKKTDSSAAGSASQSSTVDLRDVAESYFRRAYGLGVPREDHHTLLHEMTRVTGCSPFKARSLLYGSAFDKTLRPLRDRVSKDDDPSTSGKVRDVAESFFRRAYGLGVPRELHIRLIEELVNTTGCSDRAAYALFYGTSYKKLLGPLRAQIQNYPNASASQLDLYANHTAIAEALGNNNTLWPYSVVGKTSFSNSPSDRALTLVTQHSDTKLYSACVMWVEQRGDQPICVIQHNDVEIYLPVDHLRKFLANQ